MGCVLMIAIGLRFSFPERLAVEHFDEGVYASNIWFGDRPDHAYPAQHLYAPPLLPALIEWCFVFSGPSNAAAMWPSQVAGTVSVLLLWWLGRSWFGPVAGLVAAALGATNEVLVLLSRSALTDSLLGMWWLAALWALHRACGSGRPIDRLVAGLLIGLAWSTKYNGWMPLAIVAGAVVLRGMLCRGIWTQTRTALTTCVIAGAIGFATWSPWLWSLQSKGGYASVAANHRQYIVGPAGWWSSAVRQVEQLGAVRGLINEGLLIGAALGFMLFSLCLGIGTRPRNKPPNETTEEERRRLNFAHPILNSVPWSGLVVVTLLALSAPVLGMLACSCQGIVIWFWCSRKGTYELHRGDRSDLGYWILLVWFGGLLLATPLYTPYLRLTLPEVFATSLGVGLAVQQVWSVFWKGRLTPPFSPLINVPFLSQSLIVVAIAFGLGGFINPADRSFRDSFFRSFPDQSSLPSAAREIAMRIDYQQLKRMSSIASEGDPDPTTDNVYVYAEPSLLFQLRNAGVQNVAPIGSLQFAQRQYSNSQTRIYLAVGIHALSDPRFREQFAAVRGQFRHVGSWPWQLGPLVALDQPDCNPRLLGHNPMESAKVELYEVLAP